MITEDSNGARWTQLGAGEAGARYETGMMRGALSAVQVDGISGHTVAMQVSNDGVSWYALKAYDGSTDILFTADGLVEFSTGARYIRPFVAGGAGSVTVNLHFQR